MRKRKSQNEKRKMKVKNFPAKRVKSKAGSRHRIKLAWREKLLVLSFCFTLFALHFTIYSFAQDKIIAIVNNEVITQKDLDEFTNFVRMQLSAEYKGKELEEKVDAARPDLLNRLIDDRLVLQEAKKAGVVIDDSRVKAKVDEIRRKYNSEAGFQEVLMRQGMVLADLENQTREQMMMYAAIDINARKKVKVRPSEVTDFYQKHIEEFKMPEERRVDSLTLESVELANVVCGQLKKGASLEEIAQKYALNINKIDAFKGENLRKDIEEVVFSLKENEASIPLKIEDGYYIFKVTKILPPRQQSLYEAQDKIYAFLLDKKTEEEVAKWLDEVRKKAYIKICQD